MDGRADAHGRRPMHPDALGMLAVWSFAVPGLILSALLTVLKFRSEHQCDEGLLSSCRGGWLSCGTIFQDPLATVAGLPLTVYASAFYLIVAALAGLTLCSPGRLRPVARSIVLVFAWAGLLVIVLLGSYAVLYLHALCLYCAYFYGTNVALFLAARTMHPGGALAGLRPLTRPSEALLVLAVAVLGFVTAVMVQRAVYLQAVRDTDPYALQPCVTRLSGLEPSDIVVPSERTPRFVVKLFVDLDCPHCREELGMWRQLVRDANESDRPIELRVYMFPQTACDATARKLDSSASCNAARALLCLTEDLRDPADAVARLERMFELQAVDGPHFSHERLAEVAREFGVDADPARPVGEDPLFECMRSPRTTATLHRQVRLARDVAGLTAAPGALIIPLADGRPTGTASRIVGRKPRALLEAWIEGIVRDAESAP